MIPKTRWARSAGPATRLAVATAVALGLLPISAYPASAQDEEYRISQRATITQTVGQTLISLDYSRPLVRGRSELFGKVVHWGELWTPGANLATVLEVDRAIELNGHEVEPGRWSMWIIPSQVGPWEMVLDPRDSLFHTQRPELTDDQVRFVVEARHDGPATEALTWTFPRIAQDGATMRLNWGTLEVDLDVAVESTVPVLTVDEAEAKPYVGAWAITFSPNPETGEAPPPTTLTVRYADDSSLRAAFPPGAFGPPPSEIPAVDGSDMTPQERERAEAKRALASMDSEGFEYVLVPRAPGIFLMGYVQDGLLYDVEKLYHEFELEEGRAVELKVRDGNSDQVLATATRREG